MPDRRTSARWMLPLARLGASPATVLAWDVAWAAAAFLVADFEVLAAVGGVLVAIALQAVRQGYRPGRCLRLLACWLLGAGAVAGGLLTAVGLGGPPARDLGFALVLLIVPVLWGVVRRAALVAPGAGRQLACDA